MFKCKLCLKMLDQLEESKSHGGMCKPCFNMGMAYKRSIRRGYTPPHSVSKVAKYIEYAKHNRRNGLYVPDIFNEPVVMVECIWCGESFDGVESNPKCDTCYRREWNYRKQLHYMNKVKQVHFESKALVAIEDFYRDQHSVGRRVPNVFLTRFGYKKRTR